MSVGLLAVSHRYTEERLILDNITVSIAGGESVAIMGPSGSGKTTMLSILGLLTVPMDGLVLIGGEAVPVRERERRAVRATHIAWVFQTPNVLPRRSVEDNVAVSLLADGWRRELTGEPTAAALSAVGLLHLASSPVEDLSGGELQRVGVARALIKQPPLLIADEPTGQLDSHNSQLVIQAILSGCRTRSAVVIATHDPAIASHCDRVLRLVDGVLQQ